MWKMDDAPHSFLLNVNSEGSPSPCLTQNLVYDLGDSSKWEYFFPTVDKPLLIVPPGEDRPQELFDVCMHAGGGRRWGRSCYGLER